MATVYKLQIVEAGSEAVATFRGRGPVERTLTTAIAAAVLARGGWWLRRSRLERAVEAAVEDVLVGMKLEATAKHFE